MDFNSNLSKFQGALLSLGGRGMLNSADSTDAVVDLLKEIIQDLSESERFKITFFMVLNTDLSIAEKLKNDENMGLITHIITPVIEKTYLIDYLYKLNIQSHLNTIIQNYPGALTLELVDVYVKKLKEASFHKDEYGVNHIYSLWRSLFVKTWRIQKGSDCDDDGSVMFVSAFEELYALVQKVIVTSMKIGGEKLGGFIGRHLFNLFDTFKFCLNLLTNDTEDEIVERFEFSVALESKFNGKVEKPCEKCLEVIFQNLHNILEVLSVDIWMLLSECYFEPESGASMQELIGGRIYDICRQQEGWKTFRDVFNCLSALKIKPKTKSDEIAAASLKKIIANVRRKAEDEKKVWFKALVRHPDFINRNALKTALRNLALADDDDVVVILDTTLTHIIESSSQGKVGQKDSNTDLNQDKEITTENAISACDIKNDVYSSEKDESELSEAEGGKIECGRQELNLYLSKKVFLRAVKMTTEHSLWLERIFQSYRHGLLVTENSDFELKITINRLTNNQESVVIGDLVCLCMQLPEPTLERLCSFAIDSEDIEHWVGVLKTLKPACFVCSFHEELNLLEDVLMSITTSKLREKQKQSLASLVVLLVKEDLIGEKFFRFMLRLIKNDLEMDRLEEAVQCLEILQRSMQAYLTKDDVLPLAVFLTGVLGHLSWGPSTFSTVVADGRDVVDVMAGVLMKNLGDEEEKRLQWARREIGLFSERDQAYFCDLWFRFGKRWTGQGGFPTFLLALAHSTLDNPDVEFELRSLSRADILLSLTEILPVLTTSKWVSIFDRILDNYPKDGYYETLEDFAHSQYIFALRLNREDNIYPCFERCVRNLGRLVQTCIPKLTPESSAKIFKKILFVLNIIHDKEHRRDCSLALLPVFLQLTGKVKEGGGAEWENEVRKAVEVFQVKEVVEATKKKLNVVNF